MSSLLIQVGTAALAAIALMSIAHGASMDYPTRPVTIVVPFAAGSPTDITARALANDLGPILKTSILVENKSGAGQIVAASYVYRAAPDGYTLLLANLPNAIAPSAGARLPYKDFTDFAPVAEVASIGLMLATSSAMGAKDHPSLISQLRSGSGTLTYGSGGVGSVLHLTTERFNREVNAKATHVPFKSGSQVLLELAGNRLSYSFVAMNGMDLVQQGKITAIGLSASKRDPRHPELPTLSELGIPGFNASAALVLVAPKNTPVAILRRLNDAVARVIAQSGFKSRVQAIGGVTLSAPASLDEVSASIEKQERDWKQLIQSQQIQLE